MTASGGRIAGAVLGVAAAAGVAALTWGVVIERNRFTVRDEIVPVLPPGSRPITVLHLSDLHMAPWQRHKQDWVARIAELTEPDLVIDTGDVLGHPDGLVGVRRAYAPLAGIPGAFVHGSNDLFLPRPFNWLRYFGGPSRLPEEREPHDTAALTRYLADELGWWDLTNAVRAVELRGTRLELLGVDDPHLGLDRLDLLPGLVDELRATASPSGPEPVTLGIAHAPYRRVLDAFVTQGAGLVLAGHTHGGQVRVPGSGSALVANCDLPLDQAQGLSRWRHARREAWLEVSAGLGTSIYAPVRFACPPEAVVLTLVASR